MTEAEKMLVFALGALFHAARIAGATARGETQCPDASNSLDEALCFTGAARNKALLPELPPDDAR